MATAFDLQPFFYSSVQVDSVEDADPEVQATQDRINHTRALRLLFTFIKDFHLPGQGEFIYRAQLQERVKKKDYRLTVKLEHVGQFDAGLREDIMRSPNVYMSLFEDAARQALKTLIVEDTARTNVQVTLVSEEQPSPMRNLGASDLNRLVFIPGIVISASRTMSKAIEVTLGCKECPYSLYIDLEQHQGSARAPMKCPECKKDALQVMVDRSRFVDTQELKLQECPEVVPTGEMPRSLLLRCERTLVDTISPGTRVAVIGVYSVMDIAKADSGAKKAAVSVRTPFLRVMGLQHLSADSGRSAVRFSAQEEEECIHLSRQPDIYERLVRSIAPAIHGTYTDDIKKAIACLLFGGTRRKLPDGVRLRGDINVLLLGDPSTAKSQFLKFVERVAPVGVYTSGKGSSAAGLTASVVKDARGEFFLEGGAMVLADGGVVCIDEFDKMAEQDRVAIHEAMEQQTISIAKAGITTILNSRASVLAAANPVFGTYDDMKSMAENVDFLPTILSRFDMIFIVRDVRDSDKDMDIARHVLSVHINGGAQQQHDTAEEGELPLATMKRFISYARTRCAPVMSLEAEDALKTHYVKIRSDHRQRSRDKASTVPITVRQLQAVVRISEALAKMELSAEVTDKHMAEALRLFQVSTLNAANTGAADTMSKEQAKEVQRVEEEIMRAIPIGDVVDSRKLVEGLVSRLAFSQQSVARAINIMVGRNELQQINQQKSLKRIR